MIHSIRIFILLSLLQLSSTGKAEEGRFHLFSDETKTAYPSVIYDFLERYLYNLDSLQNANPIMLRHFSNDKVVFIKGDASVAKNISPQNPFSVKLVEDKFYEAKWSDLSQKEILHIVFPVNYELILGMSKNKIEKMMKSKLLSMPESFVADENFNFDFVEHEKDIYIPENFRFLDIKDLNTNIYFSKTPNNKFQPIYNSENLAYSAINLLQGIISNCNDYRMSIYQNMYDFKYEEYTIKLSQWLNYCKDINATIYAGIEEEREDGVKLLLLVQSHDLGFRHMLSVVVPWNFVDKPNTALKVKLHAFIPIHNVTTIYYEELLQNKK